MFTGTDPSWEPNRLPHSPVSAAASQGVSVHHIRHQAGCACGHKLCTALSSYHDPGSVRNRPTISMHAPWTAHDLCWEQRTQQSHGHAQHWLQPWEWGSSVFLHFHTVVVVIMSRHVWNEHFSHNMSLHSSWFILLIFNLQIVYILQLHTLHHGSSLSSQKSNV